MTTKTAISYTLAPLPDVLRSSPTILGLDASSTVLGYCLFDGTVLAFGELRLDHADIAERCRLAHAELNTLLRCYATPDVIAIESPVARFAKAVIPQCRVSGALMACASLAGLLVVEVEPATAKKALAGSGAAIRRRSHRRSCDARRTRRSSCRFRLLVGLIGHDDQRLP